MADIMRLIGSVVPYKRDTLVKYSKKIISSNTTGFYFYKEAHLF